VIAPGGDGYYHPGCLEDVGTLIRHARAHRMTLRVRGSGHSVAASIHAAGDPAHGLDVMLDRMRAVVIEPEPDGEHAIVQVEGGCNLGLDPYDPSGTSTWDNSLNVQLHRAGWALDALGGISHQTIAGFLMTGSAGGSIAHSLAATVLRLQFVDGRGDVHEVGAGDPREQRCLFEAAGVSLGLLGVITKVWLRAIRAYTLAGQEITTPVAQSPVDVFGDGSDGRPTLVDFLETEPYSRILWWPQPQFDRIQLWSAAPAGREQRTRAPFEILTAREELSGSLLQTLVGNLGDLAQVPRQLTSLEWFSQLEAALAGHRIVDRLRPAWAGASSDAPPWRRACASGVRRVAERAVRVASSSRFVNRTGHRLARRMPQRIHRLMQLYVPDGTKTFQDDWHSALPMDDHMDVRLWPTSFAELWLPLEAAPAVLGRLRELHQGENEAERYGRSRAFPVEIYAGPASPFWLSPGYGRVSLRVNPIWLDQWPGEPVGDGFQRYYDALSEFGFRPHWGKFLPGPDDTWRAYYRRHCPRLGDFLELRRALDPDQVFVNEYWREHLGITC
jgi:hypothetical protein